MSPHVSRFRDAIRRNLHYLSDEYQVDSLGLFGSYVRGEQRPDSDLDVLVSFSRPPSLLKFMKLESFLTETLGVKVDLVSRDALRKRIGARILSEVVPL